MQYSGFFNGDTEYGQEEFNRYFDNLYESGVSIDESGDMTLAVTGGTGQVTADAGFAILKGFYYYNDSPLTLDVTPDANYTRIDRVIIRVNLLSGPAEMKLKQGTASSSPQPPALQRDSNIYEISLAQATVQTDGTVTVEDERFDLSVCGAIRPKNLTEYRDMVAQFQEQFDAWFDAQQAKGWRNIFIQEGSPEGSVTGTIWIQEQSDSTAQTSGS